MRRALLSGFWFALATVTAGCTNRLVPAFDPDRPTPLMESIEVRQRQTDGIVSFALSDSMSAQALPLNVTLRSTEVGWRRLSKTISAVELRPGKDPLISNRLYLIDPATIDSLQDDAATFDSLQSELDLAAAESTFVHVLDSTGVTQTEVSVVCVRSGGGRCFRPGGRYELHVKQPAPSGAESRYQFIVERRNWGLSLGTGLVLTTLFLLLSIG